MLLTINAGSSSLKYAGFTLSAIKTALQATPATSIIPPGPLLTATSDANTLRGQVTDFPPTSDNADAMRGAVDSLLSSLPASTPLAGVVHRVVHGGPSGVGPVTLDDHWMGEISKAALHAPLHNPPALAGIAAAMEATGPSVPHVAVFDTSVHTAGMDPKAYTLPLPPHHRENGVRKYGFHGSSHPYVASLAAHYLNIPLEKARIVTAHLGSGASLAVFQDGKVLDTTMGYSPTGGIVMGSRPGDLDPGVVLAMARKVVEQGGGPDGMGTDDMLAELNRVLNRESGLYGLAGTSNMKTILEQAHDGSEEAQIARDVFVHSLTKSIHGLAGLLRDTPHALVFTGGIGEASAEIRARVCDTNPSFPIWPSLNNDCQVSSSDRIYNISNPHLDSTSSPSVFVVATDEEAFMAASAVTSRLI